MGLCSKSYSDFSLSEWLNYLENAHQQEIQLGLDRILEVARRLELLDPEATVITVAGTNGKGSTVTALETIYAVAGYNVACYISPHLIRFNERIRVNQTNISDEALCAAFIAIEAGRSEIHLTYFEMTTLAALYHFKQHSLDVIILEVGMGGRLDATNIINADLAIVTTIDLDHQDYLGDTVEAIGYEKAGIFRSKTPCIYGDFNPPTTVIEQAVALDAPLLRLGLDYEYEELSDVFRIYFQSKMLYELVRPCINLKAATMACIAVHRLEHALPVSTEQLVLAMRTVSMVGRQQLVAYPITTLYDVAHNPQAVALLADFISSYQPKAKVHAVFSALKDKDIRGLIKPMSPHVDHWYPALLDGKRAATASLLLDEFDAVLGSRPPCFSHPISAYQAAVNFASKGDIIVVYGSFLMVSAIMVAQEELA